MGYDKLDELCINTIRLLAVRLAAPHPPEEHSLHPLHSHRNIFALPSQC